jgi:hypothetical protein
MLPRLQTLPASMSASKCSFSHGPLAAVLPGSVLEVGDQDPIAGTGVVQQFGQTLTRLDIDHEFEVYEGDHGNRVTVRFVEKVLPFFSEHLQK